MPGGTLRGAARRASRIGGGRHPRFGVSTKNDRTLKISGIPLRTQSAHAGSVTWIGVGNGEWLFAIDHPYGDNERALRSLDRIP